MKKKIVSLVLASILTISNLSHVSAQNTIDPNRESNTAVHENGIVVDKTSEIIEGTEDEVRITLEAYIEGEIKEKPKPVDVLFILDQSSSMIKLMKEVKVDENGKPMYDANGNVIMEGNRTRQRVLQDSVIKLLEEIQKANQKSTCDIRVAVTTFHDTAQLLQLGPDNQPLDMANQDKSKAFQKGDQYFSNLISNIDSWTGDQIDDSKTSEAIKASGIGGLKSNTNIPEAFKFAKEITDKYQDEGRETCVVFYSDGKPQLPEYREVTIPMPEKVRVLFGDQVKVKDGSIVDLTQDLNYTDGRANGPLCNKYTNEVYRLVNSNSSVDKEKLIELVECVQGKTLTDREKEVVINSRLPGTSMLFRKASPYILWPRDEDWRFDLYKYDESVKAANQLKNSGVEVYAISTFDELDAELMADEDNSQTCSTSYVPKSYIGASRMMQLISSHYSSTTDGGMGLEMAADTTYTPSGTVEEIEPLYVDYYNPDTKKTEKKELWDTVTNGYVINGSTEAGCFQLDQSTEGANIKLNHSYNVVETPKRQSGSYYTNAKTANKLEQTLMHNISNIIFGQISSEAVIDEQSIIKDMLTDDFVLDEGFSKEDVEVYVSDCEGVGKDGKYKWGEAKKFEQVIPPYERPSIEIIGNHTIDVKGFDFQQYMVTKEQRTTVNEQGEVVADYGKKIIIVFKAKAKDDTVWGYQLPTNKPGSGIYIPGKPEIEFPKPKVDIYRDYTMKDNVVYLGNKMEGYHTLSDREANIMVNGKRNWNVDIQYILKDSSGKTYNYRVPAGQPFNDGTLYEGTDTKTKCTLGTFELNEAYTCERLITAKEDKGDLDTRKPKENAKSHVAVLKPFLPTTSIWLDNPIANKTKPSLNEVSFGTVSGEEGAKKFNEMEQTDIQWSGTDYKGKTCTKVTIEDLIRPDVTVTNGYETFQEGVYSEKDFNLQLKEGETKTVYLPGADLAADKEYEPFAEFRVTYNKYAVRIVKEIKQNEVSENMSFLFDGKVTSASNPQVSNLKPILIRETAFSDVDKDGILCGERIIYGMECREDIFEVSENLEWSWMYDMKQMDSSDNLKELYPNESKLVTNKFANVEGSNTYKGTFEFQGIHYEANKVPVVTMTIRNTKNGNTGLYHEHSVTNVFENDTIVCQ